MGLISRVSSRTYRHNTHTYSKMTDIPVELQEILSNFDDYLEKVADHFDEGTGDLVKQFPDTDNPAVKHLQQVQNQTACMYTVNSLMWLLMKLNDIDPQSYYQESTANQENPDENTQYSTLIRELQRVQRTIHVVKEGEELAKTARVDRAAAKRFIKAGVGKQGEEEEEEADK